MATQEKYNFLITARFVFAMTTAIATMTITPASAADPLPSPNAAWGSFNDEHGSISFVERTNTSTKINQTGGLYIGNSSNLDIRQNQTVTIGQDDTNSHFVAKSTNGADPTRILGALKTRVKDAGGNFTNNVGGMVTILDTNGVFFGTNSVIDSGGIIASTGTLNNNRLINDGMIELSDLGDGRVVLNGTMTIANGGLAAFVAPTVINNGIITANAGRVELAGSRTTTTIDLYGDGLVEFATGEQSDVALAARNNGEIYADGGVIHMTTGAAEDLVDSVVNTRGIARADSATQVGGKIILGGNTTKRVVVDGAVQARGATGGGEITVSGTNVSMTENGILNVRAFNTGDGGVIDFVASNRAVLNNRLRAQGGDTSGNGGTINTSGVNRLLFGSSLEVLATALNGNAGTWNIDPVDFTIDTATANLFATTLNTGMNINAAASNDVILDAVLTWTGTGALGLDAGRDVVINGMIDSLANVDLTAGRNVNFNNGSSVALNGANLQATAGSDVFVNNGSSINVTNGDLTLTANNANGGNSAIEIDGAITVDGGNSTLNATNYFVELNSTANYNQTNGTFTANSNTGFDVDTGATVNLGSADVVINAPDVRFAADINTTGTISGTADKVAIENPTASIQDGIDVAAANADLTISDGTYSEDITVTKDINIAGESTSGTILTPASSTGTSGDARAWWLVDAGVNLNLSDVTMDGAGYDVYQAIRSKGQGNIDNVAFKNIGYNPSGPNYQGVAVAAFGTGPVNITNSTFENIGRIGALYFGSTLSGSVFADNTYTGKGSGDFLDYALDISAGAQVDVLRNTITNNLGVASSDGSASAGILVSTFFGGGTTANLQNNVITGNSNGVAIGFNSTDTAEVTARNNDLSGNDNSLLVSSTSNVADFSNNYWGSTDASAIQSSMAGAGASQVDFTPFLTLGTDTDLTTNGFQGDFSNLTVTDLGNQVQAQGRIDEAIASLLDGSLTGASRIVNVTEGTYNENINVDKSLSLLGVQSGNSARFRSGVSESNINGYLKTAANLNGLRVDGFEFVNQGVSVPGFGDKASIALNNNNSNITLFGNKFRGQNIAGSRGVVTSTSGVDNVTIDRNDFQDFATGVYINPNSTNTSIINNDFENNIVGMSVDGDALVRRNRFENNSFEGVGIGGTADLVNNTFKNNGQHIGYYNGAGPDIETAGNTFFINGAQKITADMTNEELFALEDQINHVMDNPSMGRVVFKDGELFATTDTGIQAGVNASDAGDILWVSDGTFNENVTVDKALTINGDGTTNTTTLMGTGSGNGITVAADNVSLNGMIVDNFNYGVTTSGDVANLSIDDILARNNTVGFRVGNASSIDGLTITNSGFNNNRFGMYLAKDDNNIANTSNVTNVNVSDTSFDNNSDKGIYAEKLDSADFTRISVLNSGTSLANRNNAGIDINLKNGAYSNITFDDITVSGSGTDTTGMGNAFTAKARNDGTYAPTPASLTNFSLINSDITAAGSVAVAFGYGIDGLTLADNSNITGAEAVLFYGGVQNFNVENNDINVTGLSARGLSYGVASFGNTGVLNTVINNRMNGMDTGVGVIMNNTNNTSITNNVIDNFINGVQIDGAGSSSTISGNTLTNNTDTASGRSASDWTTGVGVLVNGADVDDVTISGNTIEDNTDGIRVVEGSTNVVINNNDVDRSSDKAIIVKNTNDTQITNNTLNNNFEGVRNDNADRTIIDNNTINNSTGNGIYLSRSSNNVDITNGTINNAVTGIRIEGGSNNEIDDVNILNVSSDAILLSGTSGTVVTDNLIRSTETGATGIRLTNATGSQIGGDGNSLRNRIQDVDTAVSVTNGSNNTIDGNTIVRVNDGVVASNTSGVTITDNTLTGLNAGTGISATDSTGVLIGGNNDGNSVTDFTTGIKVSGSLASQIIDNEVRGGETSISVLAGSDGTLVDDNDVRNFTTSGVSVTGADSVNITDNLIRSTETDTTGIALNSATNATVGGIGNTLRNRIQDVDTAVSITGGDTITVEGNNMQRVQSGVVASGVDGLDITDNTMTGQNAGMGVDVSSSGDVTIDGNTATDFTTGIAVSGDTDATQITGNTVNNGDTGISVTGGSDNNMVTGNTINDTLVAAISVESSDGATIQNNTLDSATGTGINLDTATNTTVGDIGSGLLNTISNFVTGIFANGGSTLNVQGNSLTDTETGIQTQNVAGLTVDQNTIAATTGDAINVNGVADVTDNIVTAGGNGIAMTNGLASNITGNQVSNVTGNGFSVSGSDNAVISGNTSNGAGIDGLLLQESDSVSVSDNTFTLSGANGVNVLLSSNTTIDGNNQITNNIASGVLVDSSTDTTIDGNVITGNANGVTVNGSTGLLQKPIVQPLVAGIASDNTVITNNEISSNTIVGIETTGDAVGEVEIAGNTLDNNPTGMSFASGTIDISDLANPNTISNSTTGMVFSPADPADDLSLANDTIGATIFDTISGDYVTLENGALFNPGTPTIIDGLAASYDGVVPLDAPLGAGLLTAVQRLAIQAKITDFIDDATLGQLVVGLTLDLDDEDLFALNLFSLQVPNPNVNVTFTGLPPVTLDAASLNAIAPAAGANFSAADFANIEPAAGGAPSSDGSDLANIEPAAGGSDGCWASTSTGDANFSSGPVNFSFGSGIDAINDEACAIQ